MVEVGGNMAVIVASDVRQVVLAKLCESRVV